ncbi:MAG: efflux RND transporter permease subunit [Sphaerochaeta sp.]
MKITDYAVDHPVPITIIVAVVVVFGILSVTSLAQAMFPDFGRPTVNIAVTYPGASPEEMEQDVTAVLEEELAKLSDVKKISSRSLPSLASITIEFDWSVDVDKKIVDVRERLSAVSSELPDGVVGQPIIRKINPNQIPILTIGVTGGSNPTDVARFLDDSVIPLFATIPGVASVDLMGSSDQALEVRLDMAALASRNVSPLEVAQALSASNVMLPAGTASYKGASMVNITMQGNFMSPEQAGQVVVGLRDGTPITVSHVADIAVREQQPDRYVLVDGEPAILLDVTARDGADTVRIIREVKKRQASLSEQVSTPLQFSYYRDQSVSIRESINSVRNSALLGGFLAIFVLYFFLGKLKPTLIIAFSILFTVMTTFVLLFLNGHTLNTMSLGGLTVAIGMIVDASIVMFENLWRHVEGGIESKLAAKRSGSEMGSAIIASTMTSIVVFVPLVFVGGITGIILKDIALTIIYALVGSVVAAILVVPFLSSHMLTDRHSAVTVRKQKPFQRFIGLLEKGYGWMIDRVLNWAGWVLLFSSLLLFLSLGLIQTLGFEFLPEGDTREIIIELDLPDGASLEDTRAKALRVDRIIEETVPEANHRVFYVGQGGAWSASPTITNHTYGFLALTEEGRSVFAIIPLLREELEKNIPDVQFNIRNGGIEESTANALGGSGFRVNVSGTDMGHVIETANDMLAFIQTDPEVVSAKISVDTSVLRIMNRIDVEKAGTLGVSPADAAQTGRIVFNGVEVGEYDHDSVKIPVIVRANLTDVLREDLLYSIPVKSKRGETISLGAFSELSEERGVSEIPRENRIPTVQLIAQTNSGNFRGVEERLNAHMATVILHEGVNWEITGSAAETASSFRSLAQALALGVFLIYAVLAIQFERYRQPLIVLSAIPFVLIGVIASLMAFDSSFSITAFLGVIALAGVAVNNSIIMIDHINFLRKNGLLLRKAIVAGASSRMRPILMTVITTLLGVLPLAFASGGAAAIAVLGQVILGGLATSTLINFFITPSLYWLTERRQDKKFGDDGFLENHTVIPAREEK